MWLGMRYLEKNGGSMDKMRVAVLGGGSWGTALAHVLAEGGHDACLFVRDASVAASIMTQHKNPHYVTQYVLHENVRAAVSFEDLCHFDMYVLAIPAQSLRGYLQSIESYLPEGCILINTAKGLEKATAKTMRDVVHETLAHKKPQYAILSGPSFADEVLQRHPTAVVLGADTKELGQRLRAIFSTAYFRCYSGKDIAGIELGGALKNIMAIAVGLCDGLGFGHNSRAALITRSLAEMSRLGVACGADAATFMGLSGLGDLTLTANGNLSRNRQVGLRLGQGESLASIVDSLGMVAEGVKTTEAVYGMIVKHGISAPITEAVYNILYTDLSPRECAMELMTRNLKDE